MLDKPVFVRGVSRSGGTLLVTILDAHPEIAMSYELYPTLLASEEGKEIKIKKLIKILHKAKNIISAARKIKTKSLRTFILRCLRGGLDNKVLAKLFQQFVDNGQDFSDISSQLRFIEKCSIEKMINMKKSRWGLKCSDQFDAYVRMWPNAYFLNVIRDGRDVAASQLNTGSFNKTPVEIAEEWVATLRRFRELIADPYVNAYEVFYEKLVSQPKEEVKKICEFLNVPYDSSMLDFFQKDLTIYSGPVGHLSIKRISKPIDTSMVGRWRKDLNEIQLEEFYSVARKTMVEFGYLREDQC
jgi:hypothetical protein